MSIFNYGNKKREIGHSDFNESFQNLHTQDFGELAPVACYEVLAGDKWKIAQNSLTKVAPMPAPAFTRIKQNFYSFFVPNQLVWRHWNDFFTNGTSYLDTYGNNQTNQDISNKWRVPSLPAVDLQLITKLANGWAAPVFRLTSDQVTKFNNLIFRGDNNPQGFNFPVEQFYNSDTSNSKISSEALWSLLISTRIIQLPSFFDKIVYVHPEINITFSSPDSNNNVSLAAPPILTNFTFASDIHTAKEFSDWLGISLTDNIVSGLPLQNEADSTLTDSTSSGSYSSFSNSYSFNFSIRFWCNIFDDYSSLDSGPFLLEKYNFDCSVPAFGSSFLSTYRFIRNINKVKHFEFTTQFFYHDGSDPSDYYVIDHFVDNCRFWNRHFGIVYNSDRSNVEGYVVNGIIFWKSSYDITIEDVPFIMDFDESYISFFSGMKLLVDNYSSFSVSSTILSQVNNLGDYNNSINSPSPNSFYYFSPFSILNPVSISDPSFSSLSYIGFRSNSCDVIFSVLQSLFSSGSNNLYSVPYNDIVTPSEFSLGFDSFGMLINSCIKCSRNLDRYNIPLEGLTSASWESYAGELINALPWFASSKIINQFFRNKVTTSAELDFSYSNGCALMNNGRLTYLNILRSLGIPLSDQVIDILDFNLLGSWVIPCSTAPKSGLTSYSTEFSSNDIFLSYVANEYHYFNIQSFSDLFSVLTGWQLTARFVDKILNFAVKKTISNSQYILLSGLLLDNVYLPNYYNGLLRMRYQNFSKDYFSSAVLDPMHGANDVQLGSTVSELRSNVAEQGFWETSSFARSIKRFFQNMVGTSPTHGDPTDPILLGIDHININIGEIVQTSQTTDNSPQGSRSGLAAAAGQGGLCKHYFNEQGWIIIFESITLEQQYYQGLEKQFTPYRNFLDYPFIDFVGLGNQSIPIREIKWQPSGKFNSSFPSYLLPLLNTYPVEGSKILYDGRSSPLFIRSVTGTTGNKQINVVANTTNGLGYDSADPRKGFDEIFGYIPRFSTYKFKLDQVHGSFRNQLDYWQSFRRFYKNPILTHEFVNWEFVSDDGELKRLFSVEDSDISDKFYVDCYINAKVTRALPVVCRPSKHL